MKIAILTNAYPPDGKGGAERIACLQAEGLASRGHEVRVWAPGSELRVAPAPSEASGSEACPERSLGESRENDGSVQRSNNQIIKQSSSNVIRFRSDFSRLERMNSIFRLFFHLRDLYPRKDLARAIAVWNPDILITHNLTGCGIGTSALITKPQTPNPKPLWTHVLHDVQLVEPSGQIQQSNNPATKQSFLQIWRSSWSLLRRWAFGVPDILVSPSKWLLDWHCGHGFRGKRDAVLPNPVEIGERRERALKRPATIAYVGRLSADKGFADVLKMISKLDSADVGSVMIVGGGPMSADAQNLGDRRVVLRGALPPAEARRVIADADILVVPSRIHENQPTVILEAMAEGTPVIATDVGGVRELLDGAGASVLAVTDDLGARLADEVAKILSDAERWKKISSALRARAEERHDAKRYFDQLERQFV